MDVGVSDQEVAAIRATVRETQGVVGLHELRTRRMAQKILIDAHIQVDGHISVSEGHWIGESVRNRVLRAHDDVLDMLVHVDPENDARAAAASSLPARQVLLDHLAKLLQQESAVPFEKVNLHYLGERVEAEVFLPPVVALDAQQVAHLQQQVSAGLSGDPLFRSVTLNCVIAPR
jgi:hypothetical protein